MSDDKGTLYVPCPPPPEGTVTVIVVAADLYYASVVSRELVEANAFDKLGMVVRAAFDQIRATLANRN